MADGDLARLFHLLTSYEPGREWDDAMDDPWLVTSFEPNDMERIPTPVKELPPELPVIQLPRTLPSADPSTLEALGGRVPAAAATLDLPNLARLLYLSAGVVRTTVGKSGYTHLFRAAGSAGGRFPLEVYVVVPDGTESLPPGVHSYRPVEHALAQVAPPPAGAIPALVVTGVPWRTGWRYRERGYRHVFWDAGTMLSQVLALASSAGLGARLYTAFPDLELRDLVGADGLTELPVAVVSLGEGDPGWIAAGRGAGGSIDSAPVHFPLVSAAHWAGIGTQWGEPWNPGEPVEGSLPEARTVDETVYRRSSTRRMDPSQGIPREALDAALGVSLRGIDVPHFVVVHDVGALEPGVYRWPDLTRPVAAGELRAELRRVALGQGLAGDAAFVVIGAADLASISDRGYRDVQLAAGLVEGRLHLAAYALGYGASGMTFRDSEIPALLRDDLEGLLFTCVGVPEVANKRAGPPGEPTPFRQVMPRLDE